MRRTALQRGVGVALWRQIADDIRRGIASGLADEKGRLPPETELAAKFGVNRHTVRAAISALIHEGVLEAVQGRGTFARKQKRLVYPISARTRFSAGFEGQATDRRSELLSHHIEPAPAEVAVALGLAERSELARLETIGKADGVPVSRATSWFEARRYPDIAEAYDRLGSITAALAELGTVDYRRKSTAVEARHATEADTLDLKLSAGAIVLLTRAVNVDSAGLVIQYSETRFPADRVELMLLS